MTLRILIALLASLVVAAVAAADGSISLRRAVSLPAGAVRLGDIASLQGTEALALADTVIVEEVHKDQSRITLEQVTKALHGNAAANFGTLTFHGSACMVSVADEAASDAAPKTVADAEPAAAGSPRLRDLVPARIAELLAVPRDEIRVTFDEADGALLNQVTADRVIEMKAIGSADRMPLSVSIYAARGDADHALVASGTIRVGVQLLRDVAVAKVVLVKGQPITIDHVTWERQWLGVAAKPAARDSAVGSVVRTGKINIGRVLMETDIEQAVAVKRGQLCSVHVISGTFVLKTQARALAAGRVGETVAFAPANAPNRSSKAGAGRTFEARIEAPGRAIMSVDGR